MGWLWLLRALEQNRRQMTLALDCSVFGSVSCTTSTVRSHSPVLSPFLPLSLSLSLSLPDYDTSTSASFMNFEFQLRIYNQRTKDIISFPFDKFKAEGVELLAESNDPRSLKLLVIAKGS